MLKVNFKDGERTTSNYTYILYLLFNLTFFKYTIFTFKGTFKVFYFLEGVEILKRLIATDAHHTRAYLSYIPRRVTNTISCFTLYYFHKSFSQRQLHVYA